MDKNMSIKDRAKYLSGAVAWILCSEYFIAEFVTAFAWKNPPYSFRFNYISDLGATSCNYIAPGTMLPVCSPLHILINAVFVLNGLLIIFGCVRLRSFFPKNTLITLSFWALGVGSLGLIMVGLVPENTILALHGASATFFFITTNIGLIMLGIGMHLHKLWPIRSLYTFATGALALIGLCVFMIPSANTLLGTGLVERIIADPFSIWLPVIGISLLVV